MDELPQDAELAGEVAIVGTGPMGVVTALELARAGHRVVLIESGAERFDEATQALSDFADDLQREPGDLHAPGRFAVRRQLGGTSVTWGGRCVPFDPIDFEVRPIVPEASWPVAYDEFARYLARACEWCVCGRAIFNANELPELSERSLVPGLPDGEVRSSDLERWSLPTRFNRVYGHALDASPLIELVTGLTCTAVVCEPGGGSVSHLELRALDGSGATARAHVYVLATGGLEATRLLLASTREHPNGIGNGSGHLGRWYMAHVQGRVARMHLSTPPEQTLHSHERDAEGFYVRRRFTLAREVQRRRGLLNGAFWIVNPELGDARHGSGILSGVYLTLKSPLGRLMLPEALREIGTKTSSPSPIRQHLRNVVTNLLPAAKFAATFLYARFVQRGPKAPGFFVRSKTNVHPLEYHGEHLPHWESRVELSDERDALGVPRLRPAVHFDQRDLASVRDALQVLDTYLREHGVGHLEYLYADLEGAVAGQLQGTVGYHQTGTTRMAASPDDGVVTPELRVHGVDDLYVAATSVFPTSSQANPTLTGVAFAVRLAEHLSPLLRGSATQRGRHPLGRETE